MRIIIDTNIALHFRRMNEIDWPKLSGHQDCILLLLPIFFRELENHKIGHPVRAIRERAQRLIT